jgi:hypothetical protein
MAPKEKEDGGSTGSSSVYVMDKEFAWMPARLISTSGDKAVVSIPTYPEEAKILSDDGKGAVSWREETISLKNYPGKTLPLQNVKDGVLIEKEDMVDLPFLHEVRFVGYVATSCLSSENVILLAFQFGTFIEARPLYRMCSKEVVVVRLVTLPDSFGLISLYLLVVVSQLHFRLPTLVFSIGCYFIQLEGAPLQCFSLYTYWRHCDCYQSLPMDDSNLH